MKNRLSRQCSWNVATLGSGSGIWWTNSSSIAVSRIMMRAPRRDRLRGRRRPRCRRRVAAGSAAGGSGRRAWPVVRSWIRRRRGWWRVRMRRSAPQTVSASSADPSISKEITAPNPFESPGDGICHRRVADGVDARVRSEVLDESAGVAPAPVRIGAGACAAPAARGTSRARQAWHRAACGAVGRSFLDRGVVA